MIKKNLLRIIILLFFLHGCGYNPIFSNKNYNFSIYELKSSGNNKLNKIIVNNQLTNNNNNTTTTQKQQHNNNTTNLQQQQQQHQQQQQQTTYKHITKTIKHI